MDILTSTATFATTITITPIGWWFNLSLFLITAHAAVWLLMFPIDVGIVYGKSKGYQFERLERFLDNIGKRYFWIVIAGMALIAGGGFLITAALVSSTFTIYGIYQDIREKRWPELQVPVWARKSVARLTTR